MDYKKQILETLEKLKQKEFVNKETFKVKAYNTVIKNIKALETPITCLDDLNDVKGIGKGIRERLKELFETGDLKQLEKYNDEIKVINELTNIHGIGPVKAKELVNEHNIKSVEDLKQHPELLNDKQKIGIRYYENFLARIPRQEMEKHDNFITSTITEINPKIKVEVVGSYRRGAKDSGDIDVIITHEDNPSNYDHIIPEIVSSLKKAKYLADDFAVGTHKYLGVCRLKYHRTFRRIDILYATKEVWPFSLMYFTGSMEFNVAIRNVALEKGLSLNEYGFKHISGKNKGKSLDKTFETEEEIMNYLGYKYIEPLQRTGNIASFKL